MSDLPEIGGDLFKPCPDVRLRDGLLLIGLEMVSLLSYNEYDAN